MASKVPNVVLNNGRNMPILGLGTLKVHGSKIRWMGFDFVPGEREVFQAIKDAIDIGYRHIDCAHIYGNESDIGEAISAKIAEGVVKREDLFITSKLWNTFHRPDLVRGAAEETLKKLGLDYVDMYLIHCPIAYKEGGDMFPRDSNNKILFSDVDYVDTWKEMEKLVDDGLAKSIGISNFNSKQTDRILAMARIPPATNQVECHPYLNQSKLMAFSRGKNIAITAFSPLGSPSRTWAQPGEPVLLEDPKILDISQKYSKTPAQILIRYQIQRGNIVIPKSVSKARLAANFNVFDFDLTAEDVAVIDGFDCNGRLFHLNDHRGHPHHPHENDEF